MITIYQRLLHLYPKEYRNEFGGEMNAVFTALRSDAAKQGVAARFRFVVRECEGLFVEAMREHWRQFAMRRFSMRGDFRFPKATWILMTLILATVIWAIEKGEAISVSLPSESLVLPPIRPASTVMSSWGLSFLIMYAVLGLVGVALFVLRRKAAKGTAEM
jgi:hypothetical protein